MPGPDTAIEEAPVLIELLIGLALLITWLAYRSGAFIWLHTVGWLMDKIASVPIPNPFGHDFHPLGFMRDVSNGVYNYMVSQALHSEAAMGRAFKAAGDLQLWLIREMWGLAKDLYHAGSWTVNTFVPTYVHGVTDIIHAAARAAGATAAEAVHLGNAGISLGHSIERGAPGQFLRWLKKYGVYAIPGAIALPWLINDVRTFNRRWEMWKHRIRRLELAFGAAAFAAYMANAIGGVTANCIRKGALGKVARKLCGLGPQALEDILGLIADVLILQNICTIVGYLEAGLQLIQPELTAFISTAESQFVNCGYDLPPYLGPINLSLPPVTGLTISLV